MPVPIQLNLFGDNDAALRQPLRVHSIGNLIDGPPAQIKGGFVVVEMRPKRWHKMLKGLVEDPIIWGLGATEKEAVEDAVQWVMTSEGRKEVEDKDDLLASGRFTVYHCSEKTVREVHRFGGEIDFVVENGRIILPKEKRFR
jgi:hypothetical protein